MRSNVAAFVCGLLFSMGLVVAEMVNPQKILAFLDIAGAWDPSLAFVMAGALITLGLLQRLILQRSAPLWEPRFKLPDHQLIDKRLIIGSTLFGLGWGILGFCPGPAIVSLSYKPLESLLFVLAMIVGMRLFYISQ